MASKERIFIDKTEIVCGLLMGTTATRVSIKASDIIEVSFSAMEVKKLLGKQKKEMLTIKVKSQQFPYVITKEKMDEKYWESYKTGMKTFCKNNRITFNDFSSMPAMAPGEAPKA
ncbi:MAG: hypothetical protein GX942_09390 [Papillibacter sp.]|jgi:iron uptake system EfeUOB component EfeO/EfeM|nr:hypothetical protein [Papillibacter sp.]